MTFTLKDLFRRILRQKKNLMTAFYSHKVLRIILGQSTFMVPFPPLPLPDSQGVELFNLQILLSFCNILL